MDVKLLVIKKLENFIKKKIKKLHNKDWSKEYLSPIVSVKSVKKS